MRSADEIDAHVGSQLRQRRIALGLSQGQVAEGLGLTFQQVQKYEKGQNRIGAGRLYRLAAILAVPVGYFYEGISEDGADPQEPAMQEDDARTFAASAEGRAVFSAFHRIKDPAIRRQLIELVETLAGNAED